MKTIKRILLFILLLICFKSHADKLEKGFEKLKVFDYFAAKEYFEKTLEDEPAAAAYGLSKIYSIEKNPFYNTDLARKYILFSDSVFKKLKKKTKKNDLNAYNNRCYSRNNNSQRVSQFHCTIVLL